VPVRIVVGRGDARTVVVTVDEAGAVHASGDVALLARWNSGLPPTGSEITTAALALAEQVLAAPLATRGIRIHTDDASV
jgi:hypothetical protein